MIQPHHYIMKNITFYFLLGLLTSSCVNSKPIKKIETQKKSYEQIVQEELATGKKNDTIFLNFNFGMNEKQVNNRFEHLMSQGKIYKCGSSKVSGRSYLNYRPFYKGYVYDFTLDSIIHQTVISNGFYNDSLYAMAVTFYNEPDFIFKYKLIDLYKTRYGKPKFEREYSDPITKTTWINGNREIVIVESDLNINIIYRELRLKLAQEIKEKMQKDIEHQIEVKEKSKKTKATKSDI